MCDGLWEWMQLSAKRSSRTRKKTFFVNVETIDLFFMG
jgi:hypothetical protein